MINDSPSFLYSIKVAESTWKKLVDDINTIDIIKVDKGERILDESLMKTIIEFLGGTVIDFSDNIDEDDEDEARKSAESKMKEYLNNKFSQTEIKGNSYFVKISNQNNFEIGCLKYNLMNILHELGHAFLDIKTARLGNLVWDDGSQFTSENMVNAFARAFAMPRDRFLKKVAEFTTRDQCDITKVAESFGVEYIHAYVRGKDLHLWD